MSLRARILAALAFANAALLALVLLVDLRAGELAERATALEARRGALRALGEQERALAERFEARLEPARKQEGREQHEQLYDRLHERVLRHVPGLPVQSVDYEIRSFGEYAGLSMRVPLGTASFDAVDDVLMRVESLQDERWIAVEGLVLEDRRAPQPGV